MHHLSSAPITCSISASLPDSSTTSLVATSLVKLSGDSLVGCSYSITKCGPSPCPLSNTPPPPPPPAQPPFPAAPPPTVVCFVAALFPGPSAECGYFNCVP
ncbi:unnamed protein product [Closterium sp. NIES-54]